MASKQASVAPCGDDGDSAPTALLNFRDVAQTVSGNTALLADRIYRSGHHADLGPAEIERLLAYDFDLVIDLRYPDERCRNASPWPASWAKRLLTHGAGSGDAPHHELVRSVGGGVPAVHRAYESFYGTLPFDPTYRTLFVEALTALAETKGRALIHCSAGKDRTGILVALLLAVLGVDRAAIAADYMLSAQEPAFRKIASDVAHHLTTDGIAAPYAVAEALAGVRSAYLDAMFKAIDARHGSVKAYLEVHGLCTHVIGRLRERFLAG